MIRRSDELFDHATMFICKDSQKNLLEEKAGLDLADGDDIFLWVERGLKDHLHPRGDPDTRQEEKFPVSL